jgi:glycosyltransferase involved in cell wall biosynthesis
VRRILLLAYYFPPIGGAGAQRNTKLARYLPEVGWGLSVVTGPGMPNYRWTPVDGSMLDEIPAETRVHRVPGPEPPRSAGWRDRAERWLRFQSVWQRWWENHVVALALDVGRDADLVYASLAPFTTSRAAERVARGLRKPLVVDLEDPWAFDEMLIYPTALHRRLDLGRMRQALRAADGIVMNTSEAAERVRERFPELAGIPVAAIPNGYDAADFAGPAPDKDGAFRIVHTGSLHTDLGLRHRRLKSVRRLLGGATPGVDLLTRSHVYVFEAVSQLVREHPELQHRVELHLAGSLTQADRDVVGGSPLVREHGFLSHHETLELMRSADLVFLPMHDVPEGQRVAIVPCKTYEYLASGRPILAAVPDGDARDLLAEAGNAYLCRPADVAAMKRALMDALAMSDSGTELPPPRRSVLERIERRRLTRDLVEFIERILVTSPASSP